MLTSNKVNDRVKLVFTSDQYCNLPTGTEGTVILVDDMGTVHVKWDNGTRLGLIPGEDKWKTLS